MIIREKFEPKMSHAKNWMATNGYTRGYVVSVIVSNFVKESNYEIHIVDTFYDILCKHDPSLKPHSTEKRHGIGHYVRHGKYKKKQYDRFRLLPSMLWSVGSNVSDIPLQKNIKDRYLWADPIHPAVNVLVVLLFREDVDQQVVDELITELEEDAILYKLTN